MTSVPERLSAGVRVGMRHTTYAFFAGWFGLSVLQQLDRTTLARAVDPTSMAIPNWRFFAPMPARHDYNVLHRDRTADGIAGPWREDSLVTPRRLSQIFWHPRRRIEKALFDLASELFQVSREIGDPRRIQLTVSYLSLLNHVSHRVPHAPGTVDVQFLIAQSAAHEDDLPPQLLFLSEWHDLAAATVTAPAAPLPASDDIATAEELLP